MARVLFRQSAKKYLLMRRVGWRIETMLLGMFWGVTRRLSPQHASAFGAFLMSNLGPKFEKHNRIIYNLKVVLNTREPNCLQTTAREVWASFGAVLAEYPHLKYYSESGDAHIQISVDPQAKAILDHKTPAIYVTSHLANWELAALTVAKQGIPLSVIFSPQSNPLIDQKIQQQRQFLGCGFISKQNALRSLVRELKAGHSIGLVSDVRIDDGELVEFFGIETPTTSTPAWLSLKLDCPIVPIQTQRLNHARYRIMYHTPLNFEGDNTEVDKSAVLMLTRRLNSIFEDWIRQQPGQWLCTKRRWPKNAYQ